MRLYVIYSDDHQNNKKKALFIAASVKKYFEVSTFSVSSKSKKQYFVESLKLLYRIIKNNVHYFILVEPWYPFLFVVLTHFVKTRFIYWSGNINFDVLKHLKTNPIVIGILKLCELGIIHSADIICSDSESMIRFFSIHNTKMQIYYLPEYIGNLQTFPQLEEKSTRLCGPRKDRPFVIGYLSTIHLEVVGSRLLPRGWELVHVCEELLNANVDNFKFIVVGDGDGLSYLKEEVSSCNFTKYFEFTGFITDELKTNFLSCFDVGYSEDYKSFLTHRFNLSSKIEEYLRAQVPVITGTQGDKRIIIGNSDNPCGICIDPLDDDLRDIRRYIHDISKAVILLKMNPDVVSKMRHYCSIEFSKRFSKEAIDTTVERVTAQLSSFA